MGKTQCRHCLVFICKVCKFIDNYNKSLADEIQALAHDDDIGIVTDITGSCTEVNDSLCTRALNTICMDMAHNVMSSDLFFFCCNIVIDVVCMSFEFVDLFLCDVKA